MQSQYAKFLSRMLPVEVSRVTNISVTLLKKCLCEFYMDRESQETIYLMQDDKQDLENVIRKQI